MNKTRISVLLAAAALASGLAGCYAQPYHGDVQVHDRNYDVRVAFTDHDRVVIRDYYRRLPPGLAKKGKIPPGHAYRLRRNDGILPDGYARIVIGADVAIMNTRTRVVVDLLEDIHD